jgi:hypothetical protein
MMLRAINCWAAAPLMAIFAWTACGSEVVVDERAESGAAGAGSGGAPTVTGTTATATTTASGTTGSTSSGGCGLPSDASPCQGKIYACGDGKDNDDDGLIDHQDPDCMGACDNTEDSFYAGIPGHPPPCLADCYFDQDSGAGNDDCYWNHRCDPSEVAPSYYPEAYNGNTCAYDSNTATPGTTSSCSELSAMQSQYCVDYCGPLTPNGCDCFGCCELPADSGNFVWLGSTGVNGESVCTLDEATDPTVCHPCAQVPSCINDCAPCELCIGKTTLPPECFDPQCPAGIEPCCGEGLEPCPKGAYCITGCCQPLPT